MLIQSKSGAPERSLRWVLKIMDRPVSRVGFVYSEATRGYGRSVKVIALLDQAYDPLECANHVRV